MLQNPKETLEKFEESLDTTEKTFKLVSRKRFFMPTYIGFAILFAVYFAYKNKAFEFWFFVVPLIEAIILGIAMIVINLYRYLMFYRKQHSTVRRTFYEIYSVESDKPYTLADDHLHMFVKRDGVIRKESFKLSDIEGKSLRIGGFEPGHKLSKGMIAQENQCYLLEEEFQEDFWSSKPKRTILIPIKDLLDSTNCEANHKLF